LSNNNLDEKAANSVGDGKQSQTGPKDRNPMRWVGYGLEFIGVLAIFSYGGWWLDKKLGHEVPWLMMVGFGMGFVGMVYLLYKETSDLRK
jgi:hypothetical protein